VCMNAMHVCMCACVYFFSLPFPLLLVHPHSQKTTAFDGDGRRPPSHGTRISSYLSNKESFFSPLSVFGYLMGISIVVQECFLRILYSVNFTILGSWYLMGILQWHKRIVA
jgi:hypothetical protein